MINVSRRVNVIIISPVLIFAIPYAQSFQVQVFQYPAFIMITLRRITGWT